MKNKEKFHARDFEKLLKDSVAEHPSKEMEERIMQKVYAYEKRKARSGFSNWMPSLVYGLLAAIFIYFSVAPATFGFEFTTHTLSLPWANHLLDIFFIEFGSIQPYLVMSAILFAVSVWLIILFNLPEEKSFRKNGLTRSTKDLL